MSAFGVRHTAHTVQRNQMSRNIMNLFDRCMRVQGVWLFHYLSNENPDRVSSLHSPDWVHWAIHQQPLICQRTFVAWEISNLLFRSRETILTLVYYHIMEAAYSTISRIRKFVRRVNKTRRRLVEAPLIKFFYLQLYLLPALNLVDVIVEHVRSRRLNQ